MWHSRPPRDPSPFMANTILNFHFDFWHPSLSEKFVDNHNGRRIEVHLAVRADCERSGWGHCGEASYLINGNLEFLWFSISCEALCLKRTNLTTTTFLLNSTFDMLTLRGKRGPTWELTTYLKSIALRELYSIRSWVALSSKVCQWVRHPIHLSRSPLRSIYKGINALYWPSIINYQLLPLHSVLYWFTSQLHHLQTHSWANWI